MNKEIHLIFDKTISSLAGFEFGKETFEKQLKEQIDYNADKIIICFPDSIKAIASSFIEGFFSEIKKAIGLTGIRQKIIINSSHAYLINKVMDSID